MSRANKTAKQPTAFDELVKDVVSRGLKPLENVSGLDAALDDYIKEHQLAFVLDENMFYIYYQEEWVRLSWYRLRRICPFVFKTAHEYMALQAPLMHRLKAAGRIYKRARCLAVSFG